MGPAPQLVRRQAGCVVMTATPQPPNTAGASYESLDTLVNALLAASRVLVGVSARSLADVEDKITITQFRTLVVLATHDGVNLNALAELLKVNASSAMRMVDRLLAAGLVNRRSNPDNRREIVLTVSTTGRRMVQRVSRKRRAEISRIVAAMPSTQRQRIVDALRAFSDAAGEPDPLGAAALGW